MPKIVKGRRHGRGGAGTNGNYGDDFFKRRDSQREESHGQENRPSRPEVNQSIVVSKRRRRKRPKGNKETSRETASHVTPATVRKQDHSHRKKDLSNTDSSSKENAPPIVQIASPKTPPPSLPTTRIRRHLQNVDRGLPTPDAVLESRYARTFEEQGVSPGMLATLSSPNYASMGIGIGHKLRLRTFVASQKLSSSPARMPRVAISKARSVSSIMAPKRPATAETSLPHVAKKKAGAIRQEHSTPRCANYGNFASTSYITPSCNQNNSTFASLASSTPCIDIQSTAPTRGLDPLMLLDSTVVDTPRIDSRSTATDSVGLTFLERPSTTAASLTNDIDTPRIDSRSTATDSVGLTFLERPSTTAASLANDKSTNEVDEEEGVDWSLLQKRLDDMDKKRAFNTYNQLLTVKSVYQRQIEPCGLFNQSRREIIMRFILLSWCHIDTFCCLSELPSQIIMLLELLMRGLNNGQRNIELVLTAPASINLFVDVKRPLKCGDLFREMKYDSCYCKSTGAGVYPKKFNNCILLEACGMAFTVLHLERTQLLQNATAYECWMGLKELVVCPTIGEASDYLCNKIERALEEGGGQLLQRLGEENVGGGQKMTLIKALRGQDKPGDPRPMHCNFHEGVHHTSIRYDPDSESGLMHDMATSIGYKISRRRRFGSTGTRRSYQQDCYGEGAHLLQGRADTFLNQQARHSDHTSLKCYNDPSEHNSRLPSNLMQESMSAEIVQRALERNAKMPAAFKSDGFFQNGWNPRLQELPECGKFIQMQSVVAYTTHHRCFVNDCAETFATPGDLLKHMLTAHPQKEKLQMTCNCGCKSNSTWTSFRKPGKHIGKCSQSGLKRIGAVIGVRGGSADRQKAPPQGLFVFRCQHCGFWTTREKNKDDHEKTCKRNPNGKQSKTKAKKNTEAKSKSITMTMSGSRVKSTGLPPLSGTKSVGLDAAEGLCLSGTDAGESIVGLPSSNALGENTTGWASLGMNEASLQSALQLLGDLDDDFAFQMGSGTPVVAGEFNLPTPKPSDDEQSPVRNAPVPAQPPTQPGRLTVEEQETRKIRSLKRQWKTACDEAEQRGLEVPPKPKDLLKWENDRDDRFLQSQVPASQRMNTAAI